MNLDGSAIDVANAWMLDTEVHGVPLGSVVLSASSGSVIDSAREDGDDGFEIRPSHQGRYAGPMQRPGATIEHVDWADSEGGAPNYLRIVYRVDGAPKEVPPTEVAFTTVQRGSYVAHVAARGLASPVRPLRLDEAFWELEGSLDDGMVADPGGLSAVCTVVESGTDERSPRIGLYMQEQERLLVDIGRGWEQWRRKQGPQPLPSDLVRGLTAIELQREVRSPGVVLTVCEPERELTILRIELRDVELAVTLFAPYAWCG